MKKQITVMAFLLLLLSSCTQRGCQSINRKLQFSERSYHIEMYSGGEIVFKDDFVGIVNQEEHSDGIYYIKNGSLIEVSGDYILTSTDK